MKESWPKMFFKQCRQNVLRHLCYNKNSNRLEAEHHLLEMDHKNRVIINWLLTVCRPWAGQLAQWHGKSLQSCPILCDPMDCSPPGSSARGILQARILEWVVTPCSRGSSWPRDRTESLKSPALAGEFFTTLNQFSQQPWELRIPLSLPPLPPPPSPSPHPLSLLLLFPLLLLLFLLPLYTMLFTPCKSKTHTQTTPNSFDSILIKIRVEIQDL